MPRSQPIEIESKGAISVVRFARPELKNPLSVETLESLDSIFEQLSKQAQTRCIVFTGSGDTFAAGADLKEVAGLDSSTAREFGLRGQTLMLNIHRSPICTIAAIDGYCMGGALDLAVSCKMRIATGRSVFAHPGPRLGIITGWGGTQFLPRLIGKKNSLGMLLTARTVTAEEALRLGLIDSISETPVESALEVGTKYLQ